MKKEYIHGEELRKHWRELQRKYRAKKKRKETETFDANGEKRKIVTVFDETESPKIFAIFDKNGNPIVAGEIIPISEIPPIKRERRKQK